MKALLFWTKVAAFVVAMWGVFFLIGFWRGEHFGVPFSAVVTVVVVGISVWHLVAYGPDVPWFAPWWSLRMKEHKRRRRELAGKQGSANR